MWRLTWSWYGRRPGWESKQRAKRFWEFEREKSMRKQHFEGWRHQRRFKEEQHHHHGNPEHSISHRAGGNNPPLWVRTNAHYLQPGGFWRPRQLFILGLVHVHLVLLLFRDPPHHHSGVHQPQRQGAHLLGRLHNGFCDVVHAYAVGRFGHLPHFLRTLLTCGQDRSHSDLLCVLRPVRSRGGTDPSQTRGDQRVPVHRAGLAEGPGGVRGLHHLYLFGFGLLQLVSWAPVVCGCLLNLLHRFSPHHHPHHRQVVGSNPDPAGQMPDGVQRTGGSNVPHGCDHMARLQFPECVETTKLQKLFLEQAGGCVLHDLHQSDRLHRGYGLLSASGVLRFTCLENHNGCVIKCLWCSSFVCFEMLNLLNISRLWHQLGWEVQFIYRQF